MTADEQASEEERLHDEFTHLLQDLETYLAPITAEIDFWLRYTVYTTVTEYTPKTLPQIRSFSMYSYNS